MTKLDEDKARQGSRGKPVLVVLIAGLALCAIVFVGMLFYGANEPDPDLDNPGQTASETAPAASTSTTTDDTVVAPNDGGVTGTDNSAN